MPSARPTHFLCLPLATPASLPQLTTSLALFAQDKAIQQNSDIRRLVKQQTSLGRKKRSGFGADSSDEDVQPIASREGYVPIKAIRPVGTLHLTLGVMSLDSKSKIDAASEFLRTTDIDSLLSETEQPSQQDKGQSSSVASNFVSNETGAVQSPDPTGHDSSKQEQSQFVVKLKGLHAMQQSTKTRVLYAEPIDASGRLISFCQRLRSRFIQEGFMVDEERDLKLHATIVNTIYASKRGRNSTSKTRMEFDASDLIERWKDKVWTEVSIGKVAICEMGAKEDAEGQVKYLEIAERVFGQ